VFAITNGFLPYDQQHRHSSSPPNIAATTTTANGSEQAQHDSDLINSNSINSNSTSNGSMIAEEEEEGGQKKREYDSNRHAVISGSWDETIKVWALDGACRLTLRFHDHYVTTLKHLQTDCVDFHCHRKSPSYHDNHFKVLSGSYDNIIQMFDYSTGQPLISLDCSDLGSYSGNELPFESSELETDFSGGVLSLQVFDSGRSALAGHNGGILYWDLETSKVRGHFMGHDDNVNGLSFVEHHTFVSVSKDRSICIWDVRESPTGCKTIGNHNSSVTCVATYPQANFQIASGCNDGIIKLHDLRKMSYTRSLSCHGNGGVFSLVMEPYRLISGGADGSIIVQNFDV